MRLFGFEIARSKALTLSAVDDSRGWVTILDRPPGAFQKDLHYGHHHHLAQANWVVFACETLIAGDIGKLRPTIVEEDKKTGVYQEVESAAFSPVLRKPNGYQTWQKFVEQWMLSKLSHGNAYMLKERDNRNVVVGLTVLDPHKVTPLVSPNGSVYYQLGEDDLAQVPEGLPAVPASEIMHDRMWCLFHPLIGLGPIFAAWLAAMQGLEIQKNSSRFFANNSSPGGILLVPGSITDDRAQKMKDHWDKNYSGEKAGGVAVLTEGLKFEPMRMTAVDSQMAEQLRLSAEMICTTFHVPAYKVGVGPTPTYQNAEILNQIYYDDCLQTLIQGVESMLDEGLGLTVVPGRWLCSKLDLDDLLRMDSATKIEMLNNAVKGGLLSPNEGRAKLNYLPVKGGDSPMIQQQQFSLAALAERDANKPFAKPPAAPTVPANDTPPAEPDPAAAKTIAYAVIARARKELKHAARR